MADLKGVGQNYQDHSSIPEQIMFDNTEDVELFDIKKAKTVPSVLNYLIRGKGKSWQFLNLTVYYFSIIQNIVRISKLKYLLISLFENFLVISFSKLGLYRCAKIGKA